MSNDGGAPFPNGEPTSFGLQQPQQPQQPHGQGSVPPYGQGPVPSYGQDPRQAQGGGPGQPQNPYGGGPHPGDPYAPGSVNPYSRPTAPTQAHPAGPASPEAPQPPVAPGGAPAQPPLPTQVVPDPEPDPGAGRLIAGRYRLLSKLGHGGMGTVWRAKDETVDREVAVKEPRVPEHLPERERATAFERMRREARAAARLDHPAVVNVHDVAVEDGQPWIVMEFVQGRSMGAALQEGTLGAREAARVGLEVLGALEAAHQAGILHRDVKPDNVMLGRYDRVVLTDFGIAQIEGETNLTDTGGFVGSPEFIAPERVLGQRPGPASDLWSLGVVLYAATEGVSPFRRSNTPATLQSVLNATPAAPASATGPLAEAINGLLQKDPAHRPDAATVRRLLEEAVRPPLPQPATQLMTASGGVPGPTDGIRVGRKLLYGAGAAFLALVLALGVAVADPFAGGAEDGAWYTPKFPKAIGASVEVPEGYVESDKPDKYEDDEYWLQYSDVSWSISVHLEHLRKDEDKSGRIAGTASAQANADAEKIRQGTSSEFDSDEAEVKTKVTDYEGKEAAENLVTFKTESGAPREVRIMYYRAKNGDMYRLRIWYPGAGDLVERGREVAEHAVKTLKVVNP
ncbi:protein kinase domain-containing protein [Streptomyces sp. KLOTTS4A1]|uniref:serine/threonine-protein kinase n=1 Tax=Streptomyces sp. KLOTTS4A1 TaxID=3390996 RepID=UPI0039F53D98